MRIVLGQCHKVLSENALCCLFVGDSTLAGVRIPVHKPIVDVAEDVGFRLQAHEVDRIRDRRIPPLRAHHTSVIEQEHLLLLKRLKAPKRE
jgi:hypothetical protein